MFQELLTSMAQVLNDISGGNQMISGAISLWLLGTMTYLARNIPNTIYLFLKRNFTTTMTMNNGGWEEKETMVKFMSWLQPRLSQGMSRTLSISTEYLDNKKTNVLGVGYGYHFFFYNKRLFWLYKTKLESSGSERQKEEIIIGTIGRSHSAFKNILDDFSPVERDDTVSLYKLDNDGDWRKFSEMPKRPIESVAVSEDIKDMLISRVQHMKDNPEWFAKRGLSHKVTFLLHGIPGTGKTSLIKAVASHFNMNVCTINISLMTDNTLQAGLASVPENSAVIIEDFDSNSATKARDNGGGSSVINTGTDFSMLSLTGVLNALDGVVPLNNVVLFLTTNHIEKIDPAVYRKGRVDQVIEIGKVNGEDVKRYANYIYPDYTFDNVIFKPTIGCFLNQALLEGKDDPDEFITSLKKNDCIEYKLKAA